MSALPADYAERVYAGVLGKVIGVYLGRPFEGWTYERIQSQLGDIENYVHEQLGVPLLVTDDDISGTFTFARALADNNFPRELTSADIGRTWLNYLIEDRTILWWGGLGNSTEHTAYLRLRNGVEAPASGSAALNGQVVAEQIGAQIFIDGWAMAAPGDAERAAYLATQAARVSHDGAAVDGAVVLAVMEAMAFVEQNTNKLLDTALKYIDADSIIRRLIDDIRHWHAGNNDWRDTRAQIAAHYGYDKYGGNCHMVPNHGLIVHSLLHCNDDFSLGMQIINTSGWDTDCNSGNLGCLLGIKLGLAGIDAGPVDWRGPVADRIYVPTADPTWGISDCVREADAIVQAGRALAAQPHAAPKQGARFHFSYPGSVQGFTLSDGEGQINNVEVDDRRCLALSASKQASFATPVFAPSKAMAKYFEKGGYALLASPLVYPGQEIYAKLHSESGADAALYVSFYGADDEPEHVIGQPVHVQGETRLTLEIPASAHPVFEVGVVLPHGGTVLLDALDWTGTPDVAFTQPPHRGSMWRCAFVNGTDILNSWVEPLRLVQNSGRGLVIQGTRDWCDYQVSADITPHLVEAVGLAGRVQGMRRYYALVWQRDGELQLVRMLNEPQVLARCAYSWPFGEQHELSLQFSGSRIVGLVDGEPRLHATDAALTCGAMALLVEAGRTGTHAIRVAPL